MPDPKPPKVLPLAARADPPAAPAPQLVRWGLPRVPSYGRRGLGVSIDCPCCGTTLLGTQVAGVEANPTDKDSPAVAFVLDCPQCRALVRVAAQAPAEK